MRKISIRGVFGIEPRSGRRVIPYVLTEKEVRKLKKKMAGPNVIRIASGKIAHVSEPLGMEATRDLVTEDVIRDVLEARKAAGLDGGGFW